MEKTEGKLKITICVKEFSKKESKLFSAKRQMEVCEEFIKNQN